MRQKCGIQQSKIILKINSILIIIVQFNTIFRGAGVVVGIIDTGVFQGHEALEESFAGAWLDPHYDSR